MRRSPSSASAAVSHSSRRSRVTRRRTNARPTASSDTSIWCARSVSVRKTVKLVAKRLPKASLAILGRPAKTARVSPKPNSTHAGTKRIQIAARVHRKGWSVTNQPNKNSAKVAGSTRLRRRLSRIFQRETREIGLGTRAPDSSGTRSVSHSTICQSPRSQRCFRRPYAL